MKSVVLEVARFLLMGKNSLTSLIALPEQVNLSLIAKETFFPTGEMVQGFSACIEKAYNIACWF